MEKQSGYKADLVISSSNIYTVKDEKTISGSVAVYGNKILTVGTKEKIAPLIGPQTKVYKMEDKLVLPGFFDAHTHIEGPVASLNRANLYGITSREECVKIVKEWADTHPDEEWVMGLGWNNSNWEDKSFPTKELLDAVIPERPVYLQDQDWHNGWFNSKALELLGINKDTQVPAAWGGKIYKDAKGDPTGYISDAQAMDAFYELFYKHIEENAERYLDISIREHLKHGITGINEMGPWMNERSGFVRALRNFEDEGKLNLRVFLHFGAFQNTLEDIIRAQEKYQSNKLKVNGIKILIDGVWATHSGAMLKPYADDPENSGKLYYTPEELAEKVIAADKEGLYIRIHCSGDRAVRVALDAYQAAINQNGDRDRRSSIEHIDVVHDDDLPRFAELGVIANVTPEFMAPTNKWDDNPCLFVFDEEQRKEAWRFNSLIKSGAMITYGADCVGMSLNPLLQIHRGLTRVCNDGEPKGGFMPKEKVSVIDAIRCYTYNSAYEAGMENRLGTLEEGKLADIIILDKNIFEVPIDDLLKTKVVLTIVDGKVVYEK